MRLIRDDDPMVRKLSFDLEAHLLTRWMGRIIEIHESIGSTNDRARNLAREGGVRGLTIVALEQTSGRGQRGRTWHSPAGAGLYASFLLRPKIMPRLAPTLTLVAGVAVRDALQRFSAAPLALKWPNDVLVNAGPHRGKKLAGILMEASVDSFQIDHAIVGVGANLYECEWPEEIAARACALASLEGEPFDHSIVLSAISNALEERIEQAETDGLSSITSVFSDYAYGLGEHVSVSVDDEVIEGRFDGVTEDGALQITCDGKKRVIYRGNLDVSAIGATN